MYAKALCLSKSFGWLWKEPVCYSRYSKWCPFAFTHAGSRTRHWSIASSMTSWDRLDRVLMRRCFSWLTSVNSTSFSELLKQPVDATFRPSFVRKFCRQPASIVSFRQMQTFDQYLVFVTERHCLQLLQWGHGVDMHWLVVGPDCDLVDVISCVLFIWNCWVLSHYLSLVDFGLSTPSKLLITM